MAIEITAKGRSARDATVRDLQKAIKHMNAAIDELNKCKGMGTQLYINRLYSMITKYTNIKNTISRIH